MERMVSTNEGFPLMHEEAFGECRLLSRGRVRLTFSIMDSLHGGLCTGYSSIKSFPILVKERERGGRSGRKDS